ncbi:MAG: hypothetical protein ACI8ZO_001425, partial [Flavobacteriales bacterium]
KITCTVKRLHKIQFINERTDKRYGVYQYVAKH